MNNRKQPRLLVKASLALGLLLLLGSLTLNIFLFRYAVNYYRQLNEVRLSPLGLEQHPLTPDAPVTDATLVVFIGDSRAAEWPTPNVPGIQFSNLGIGAQTSAQMLLRYEAHVAPLEPDIIILQVGINDLKTIPLFPERREELVTDCQDNIAAIVTKARADGALVILSTVFPAGDVPLQRRPLWSAEIDAAIVEVNAFLQTLADDHILVFDSYSLLADDEGILSSDYARDELHLNSAGYERLNEALAQLLGTVVESTDVE